MTSLKNLPDDTLYLHFVHEIGELRDAVDELRYTVLHGRRAKITDALDGVNAPLSRVTELHAELKARGVVA